MRGGQLATVLAPVAGQLARPGRSSGWASSARCRACSAEAARRSSLLLRGGAAAGGRADLLAQPGQPARPGGGGLGALGDAAFGRGELGLGRGALGDGGGQDLAARLQPRGQPLFLARAARRPAGPVRRGRARGVRGRPARSAGLCRCAARFCVPRSRSASEDRANQVSWARASRGRGLLRDCSSSVSVVLAWASCCSRAARRATAAASSASSRCRSAASVHVVVGQQPEPGVAQLGLDDGRLPGHLGLPAEGLEPAAQLGGQVDQPGQVGLHGLQLAQRLLLALAVLEHAGRFLDQGPPGLGARVQDVVELALADDHVHLPAQPGVGQQFLRRRAAGSGRR